MDTPGNDWPRRIASSDIPDQLEAVQVLIPDLDGETTRFEVLNQVDHAMRFFENELQVRDPLLITEAKITAMGTQLRTLAAKLTTWLPTEHASHLTHLQTALDAVLTTLASIPVQRAEATPEEEIATLRRALGQYKGQAERAASELSESTTATQAALVAATTAAEAKTSELQAEAENLKAEIARINENSTSKANETQEAFAASQARHETAFTELVDTQREALNTRVDEIGVDSAAKLAGYTSGAEAKLVEIDKAKDRIDTLVGIAGDTTLVGGYSKNAKAAKWAAFRWTLAAVILAGAAVGVGIWAMDAARAAGTDWDLFAGRTVLTLAAAAISAYAARQAAEHRHAQREAEHVALQLASLKPFLDDLENPEDRDAVLKEVSLKMFGEPRRFAGKGSEAPPTTAAQLSELLELASKLKP